jgi:cytochrome d ubiquinol oxidase subunit II
MLMALVLGVALGNVIRGVPLDATGYFRAPLFTHFRTDPADLGAIDWYTALVGMFAVVALGAHGAIYLVKKTTGAVRARSARAAKRLWVAVLSLGIGVTIATGFVQPALFARLASRPASWPLGLVILVGAVLPIYALVKDRERLAFAGSTLLLVGMLFATAAGLFPLILRSSIDPSLSLDAFNASTGSSALTIGLFWWIPAILLAVGYFFYLFRSFRGKVTAGGGHY